jgi:hypothetical protein
MVVLRLRGARRGVSELFLLGTAYVDLEVHVPFAQRLGVGDHPILAFEREDVTTCSTSPT